MNFTGEIKRELLRTATEKDCCRCAVLAAATDTGGRSGNDGEGRRLLAFTSENEEIAAYLLECFERRFGAELTLTEATRDPKHNKSKLSFSYFGENRDEIAEQIAAHGPSPGLSDCCAEAYLRGAFLCGGSCTLPREGTKTGYHLELAFGDPSAAENFLGLLERFQIIGSLISRGDRHVVYLKSREAISDFLAAIGADGALGNFERISAARDENNLRNRRENCTANNADRAAIASAERVIAIRELEKRGIFSTLDKSLKETAALCLRHPELSLTELGGLASVSKSCLNHRLRKLMRLARNT